MASSFGYASASGPGCRPAGTNIAGGTINGGRPRLNRNGITRPDHHFPESDFTKLYHWHLPLTLTLFSDRLLEHRKPSTTSDGRRTR